MERRIAADRRKREKLLAQLRAKVDRAGAQVLNAYIISLDVMNLTSGSGEEIQQAVDLVGKVRQAHELLLDAAKLAKEPTP